MPQPIANLSPEQWAEARSMRANGAGWTAIAQHLKVHASALTRRAQKEGWAWPDPVRATSLPTRRARPARPSPATAPIRSRLALRLFRVIECKIRMMELRMIKELQAHEQADGDGPLPSIADEREAFAALIDSINQVTEMASEPATAPDARTRSRSVAGTIGSAINPELTALSTDIDPDGLAVASEKDNYRRELAEHLAKMFPKP